jgi:hypothetical protein
MVVKKKKLKKEVVSVSPQIYTLSGDRNSANQATMRAEHRHTGRQLEKTTDGFPQTVHFIGKIKATMKPHSTQRSNHA